MNDVARTADPKIYSVFMDGNAWCAIANGFLNLQESIAGFGESPVTALGALIVAENDAEIMTEHRPQDTLGAQYDRVREYSYRLEKDLERLGGLLQKANRLLGTLAECFGDDEDEFKDIKALRDELDADRSGLGRIS